MLVLLVEDDDRTAHALTDSLRLHRIKVLRAATGAEALAQMSSKVDAVLLDLGLPDGHGSCISA
ncbi:MAG: response regulator [Motilibacteraceae bacterium]